MGRTKSKMRQLVDWRAAIWAGLISGAIFLVISMVLTNSYVGSPWVVVRLIASIALGEGVLPPPATIDAKIFTVAFIVHIALSISFACLIAYVLHRWGLIVGILGGSALGLALYAINFYTVTFFFPWFFPMRSWIMVVSHAIFGACAGGIYEALEVEEFVSIEA